ncbi:hypothetical protein BCR34DRAFT_323932 [Clohesyomyces aquaticus]|uniref:Uncharacterized protein n=1 Tax=Clohesyomyces aquaticus TaxID=1231657 RepID=A0A1Y1ZMQ2_9PLEO|nr:hypothetical protein BCR34DRAFT_323932 [Clohesyomyces aquaticus]
MQTSWAHKRTTKEGVARRSRAGTVNGMEWQGRSTSRRKIKRQTRQACRRDLRPTEQVEWSVFFVGNTAAVSARGAGRSPMDEWGKPLIKARLAERCVGKGKRRRSSKLSFHSCGGGTATACMLCSSAAGPRRYLQGRDHLGHSSVGSGSAKI